MNETAKGVVPSGPKGKRGVRGSGPDLGAGASTSARRLAAAILEVLAGSRTPLQAAQVLGLSLPRYYLLEMRALQGLLLACEPRSVGRVATAESALASLQRECEQLRRECARQQALVRAAQRAIGLAPPAPSAAKPMREGKKRRQRRPVARALRAAARLQPEEVAPSPGVDKPESGQG
jgi:hypothetical protein